MTRLLVALAIVVACGDSTPPNVGRQSGAHAPTHSWVHPSQVFDVMDYGARGDGVTDDGASIRETMTAACAVATTGKPIVFFPPGHFPAGQDGSHFWSLLVPCSNLTLQGVPGQSVVMQPSGMPNAPIPLWQVTSQSHITFDSLIIDGNWQNAWGKVAAASNGQAVPGGTPATITMQDASFFPATGGAFTAILHDDVQAFLNCTAATATTLTCTGPGTGTLYTDTTIGYVDAQAGINQTTQSTVISSVASGSNGATLPQSTINIASTATFTNGTANYWIQTSQGYQLVTCLGAISNQLTTCSGGTGTLSTGGEVFANASTQGRNSGINVTSGDNIDIRNVTIQRIYGDCITLVGNVTPTSNVRIVDTTCNMASRDGIAFSSATKDVTVDRFHSYSVSAQAFDGEPVAWGLPNITIAHSQGRGWWNLVTHGSAPMTIGGGNLTSSTALSTDAKGWRVHDNLFEGAVIIGNASDVVFDNNTVEQAYANDDISPIWINGWTQDVTISNNTVKTRSATSGTEGLSDCCGILAEAFSYGSSGAIATSINLRITGNKVHVKNGRYGIVLDGVGQLASGTTGTASAVGTTVVGGLTYATMTDSGASWTAHQWIGAIVRIGTVEATVQENTTTLLTLNHVQSVNTSNGGWFTTDTWKPADVPALGAYTITFLTGAAEVSGNTVEGQDDGHGKGKQCYVVGTGTGNVVTTRVRVHHNIAYDCDTTAFVMHSQITNAIPYVEFSDNYAYDDQPTPTTTHAFGLVNALKVTKFVLRDNQVGEGVTNFTNTLTSGTWLESDGINQQWAGFGAPSMSAPKGSTYRRLDGGAGTTFYVNEGGSTTWIGK